MIKTVCVLLFTLVIYTNKVNAQVVHAWAGGADVTNTSFGMCFEYVSNDYRIIKKSDWRGAYFDNAANRYVTNGLNSISSSSSPGFGIGFIYRVRLSDLLEVRTTPSLVLADRTLSYVIQPTALSTERTVHASVFEVPLLFKIKSERLGNFRGYMIGGVKYSIGISAPKADDPNMAALDKLVENKRTYASYEVGVGFDVYFEYFKFSPELKLSNSFGSVLLPQDNPYSRPIDKLFLHCLVFSINLE